jgi:DNA (cytosine-5)-methyltransferase 1
LALIGLQVVDRVRPRWVVFENVPGLLSSDEWRDFGAFLACLGQCGYGFAYRVLDAQYFGVPQRRRRVFVVGHLGDWRPAAAVLFEPSSLRGNPPPSREAGKGIAGSLAASPGGSDENDAKDGRLICGPLAANGATDRKHGYGMGQQDYESGYAVVADTVRSHPRPGSNSLGNITHSLRADGFDAGEDGTRRGMPLVPVAFDARQSDVCVYGDRCAPLDTDGCSQAVAFDTTQITHPANYSDPQPGDPCHPLARGGHPPAIAFTVSDQSNGFAWDTSSRQYGIRTSTAVRRLTPTECERLQGFPDGWTAIRYNGKPAADGPRYRALGNAMAVPVVRWILNRLSEVAQPLHAIQEAAA